MPDRKVDYLLIGGGLATANCARWLRESGAEGALMLVGREPDPPYNRPNCSKGYLRGEEEREEAFFRPQEWWREQDIELLTRTSVMALDAQARTAKLSNKQEVEFSKALIATGANVRRLNVDGCELEQIHYLRTLGNADAIRDAVVVGAGVTPDVQLAQRAGLEIGERGGVRCSSRLESSIPGLFAAGDICEYDSVVHAGAPVRIEHWDVAFNHGKTAALNMLGRDVAHEEIPYFYSVLADWGELEYVGPAYEWDDEIVRGSFEEGSFTVWYLKGSTVKAALTFGRSDDLEHARR